MALEGIRLTDLYGYSNNDYHTFIDNNINMINNKISSYPNEDPEEVKEELYLNNLLINKIGQDKYDKEVKGTGWEYKKNYYNNLFSKEPEENISNTPDITNEIDSDLESQLFVNGDIVPSKYGNTQTPMSINEYFAFGIGEPNMENFTSDLFNKLYSKKYQRVGENIIDSPETNKDVDDYAAEIRTILDNDRNFNYKFFTQFDETMRKVSNYYNNYHDTNLLPITPNEMKDIMAKYYAINIIKGNDQANQFAASTFQNIASDNQGWFTKLTNGILQASANFSGDLIATAGIVLNTLDGLYKASSRDFDVDDVGWFKEFLMYAAQNPLTEYGNLCVETNTWLPSLQEERKKAGYNPYQIIRHYGHEADFLDVNTLFELPPQLAFTAAAMLSGSAANSFLKGTVKGITSAATRDLMTKGASNFSKVVGRGIDTLGDAIVLSGTALLPAAAEASMDAFQTYDNIMSGNLNDIDALVNDAVRQDIDDGTFLNYLYSKHPLRLPSPEQSGKMSDDDINRIYEEFNYNYETELQNYIQEKKQELLSDPDIQDMLEETAFRGAARNLYDETMFIAFGDAMFTKVLGGGFKATKNKILRNLGRQSEFELFRNTDDLLRAKAKPQTFWSKNIRPAAAGIIEATEEGVEELFQNVDTQMRLDLASDYASKWIENIHNPDALQDLSDSFTDSYNVASASIGRNLLSKESIYSFLMGAVSAGLGQPTILNGIRQSAAAKNAGIKRSAWDKISSFWRNPIYESIKDSRNEQARYNQEVEDVNRWLENHEEVARIKDFNSLFAWMNDQTKSAESNNEADFRDAIMGQKVATIMMMDRIGGSAKEKSFSKRLREMSKLSYNSEEANSLINQAIQIQGLDNVTEEKRKDIFDNIVSKSKDLVDLQNKVHNIRQWINSNFGEILSSESIDAWTYETLMHEDLKDRIESINTAVKDAWNRNLSIDASSAAGSTTQQENALAKHGSIESAQKRLSNLQNQLKSTQKIKGTLVRKLGKFGYKNYIDTIKDDIKSVRKDISILNENPEGVISAEKIAALSPESRAAILLDENYKNYSKEQQEEIDRFKNSETITKDVLDSINDAAKLQKKYDTYTRRFDAFEKDARSATLYDNEIKRKSLKKLAEDVLKDAINAETYEDFKSAVDKILNDDKYEYLNPVINDVLKDNKNFDRYTKELQSRNSALDIMLGSPIYSSLTDNEKRILNQAYFVSLSESDTSFDNVYKNLSNNNLLEKFGLSLDDLSEDFLSKVKDILQQIKNFQSTIKLFEDQKESLTGQAGKKQTGNKQKSSTEQSGKILSKTIYDNNKDRIDQIVNNISNYLIKKTNKLPLSKDDFLLMLKLVGREEFTSDILIDDFKVSFNIKDLSELLNSLQTALGEMMYSNPDAADDVRFKNTKIMMNAVSKFIENVSLRSQLTGIMSDKDFLVNSLIELNPAFNKILNPQKSKPKNLQKLGSFSIMTSDGVDTESEKRFYEDYDIQKNLSTLAKLNMSRQSNDVLKTVFVYDKNLGQSILQETGEESFSSDNLPLIAGILVQSDVEGSILVDGVRILPIGLVGKSRKSPSIDPVNSLNALRQMVIDNDQSGIVKNADNTIYKCDGITIKFHQKQQGIESDVLRDKLIEKHGGDREAAFNDFQRGITKVTLTIDHSTRVVTGTYKYNNKSYSFSYLAADGTWSRKDKTQHTLNAYIDESNPSSPNLLFSKDIINDKIDGDITVQMLLSNDDDLSSKKYDREDINNIASAVTVVRKTLKSNLSSIIRYGENTKVSDAITQQIDKNYLNLGRESYEKSSPVNLKFKYSDGRLIAIMSSDYSGDTEIASVDVKNNTISQKDLNRFSKDVIKNIIFDEDGKVRIKPDSNDTLIKIQVKDDDVLNKDNGKTDTGYQRRVFFAGLYTSRPLSSNIAVSEVSINETSQNKSSSTGNLIKDAFENLSKYKKIGDGSTQKIPGSIGVTTFINGIRDNEDDLTVKERVSMYLGTSIDKLVRVYFQTGKNLDDVKKWMLDQGLSTWPGFGGAGNQEFVSIIRQIEKISKFFENRQEVPVTDEFLFSGEVVSSNGKRVKLTAIPDIITVDKNGKYHIYDMKSFKYTQNALSKLQGMNNPIKLFKGLDNKDVKLKKWREQLTLYKTLIEQMLGEGSVASLGVIPIALNYSLPEKSTIGPRKISQIGEQVQEMLVPMGDKMVPLHVSSEKTTIYDDVISITPIEDITTIAPDMWKDDSSKKPLNDVISEIKESKNKAETVAEIIPSQQPIEQKDLNKMSDQEILSMLGLDEKSFMIEELNNLNEC